MNAKIRIGKETTIQNVPACKEIIGMLKDAELAMLDCIDTETRDLVEITTIKSTRPTAEVKKVFCGRLKRVGKPEITVQHSTYDIQPVIEVSFLAKGYIQIDGKFYSVLAEVEAMAKWNDGWYAWNEANEDGTPKAPYARLYIEE